MEEGQDVKKGQPMTVLMRHYLRRITNTREELSAVEKDILELILN